MAADLPISTTPVGLTTSDGVGLEAELAEPNGTAPIATAVLCHPHPLYGGNMYNNVVGGLFAHLPPRGVACLRFNFRGTGRSAGSHGDGAAERLDVEAAVAELAGRWPDVPLVLAGYSFGADVSLSVTDDRIAGWLAVAPPLRVLPIGEMGAASDPRPTRIATGTADDFRPAEQARDATASWTNCGVTPIEGANHFFATGIDGVQRAADELLAELTAG